MQIRSFYLLLINNVLGLNQGCFIVIELQPSGIGDVQM